MLEDGTANVAGKTALAVSLAQKLMLGAIITATGFILLAVSGKQDISNLLQEQSNPTLSNTPSAAPKTAAIANWLMVIGIAILTQVSVIRVEEANANVQPSTDANSIIPNINIATGYNIILLGSIIKAIGFQQRAEQPQSRVTTV